VRSISVERRWGLLVEKPVIDRIFQVPDLTMVDLRRDGTSALISSNDTGSYQLYLVPTDGGERRQLTFGKDRVLLGRFSRRGDLVAFHRDRGGREEYRIYAVGTDGARQRGIMTAGGYRIFDLSWSPDGLAIAFAASTMKANGVWVVGTTGAAPKLLFRCRHPAYGAEWDPAGRRLAFAAGTTEDPRAIELVVSEGTRRHGRVYTPKAGSQNTGPKWSPDGKALLFKSDFQGVYELWTLQLDGMERHAVGASGRGLDFPAYGWFLDGSGLWYLASARGRTALWLRRDGIETRVPLPVGTHSHVDVSEDARFVVFSWSSLTRPPALARHDFESGETHVLYDPMRADPDLAEELAVSDDFEYTTFDNRRIHGYRLTPPRTEGKPPCLLWPHGGPFWLVGDFWNPALQALATAGYTVLGPNFRGSTDYGSEFQKLIYGDPGGGDLLDMVECRRHAVELGWAEPGRIGMIGASYGGFMTNIALVKFPDLWDCGFSIVSVTDWKEDYDLADASFRSFDEELLGKPTKDNYLYFDRSPIHFVDRLKVPLLLWHRANDSRCPIEPVRKFARKARALGKDVRLVAVRGEGHGPQKTENLTRQYKAAVEFLSRHLKEGRGPVAVARRERS